MSDDYTTADYVDTTGEDDAGEPSYLEAGYHDETGFPGLSRLKRAARGATRLATRAVRQNVTSVARAATRGVPAVAQLMRAPDMLTKTVSAAGATALRTLKKADPSVYLSTVQAGLRQLTSNDAFNTAISGAQFIPGIGTAVSSGMAAAAALGRGESIEDTAIAAAREGFENPAAQFAFDSAVGIAKGGDLSDAATEAARGLVPGGPAGKAAFDAGLALARRSAMDPDMANAVRQSIEGDGDTSAFDGAMSRAGRATRVDTLPEFGLLRGEAQQAARAFMSLPHLRRMRLRDAAEEIGVNTRTAQEAVAACCNHFGNTGAIEWSDVGDLDTAEETGQRLRVVRSGQSWDGARPKVRPASSRRVPRLRFSRAWALKLGKVGGPNVMNALVRHGVLARIAGDTGELTGPTQWTIRAGDYPSAVAQKLTGNGGRWKEIVSANAGMQIYTDAKGQTQIKPWNVGQAFNVPPSWVGAPAPGAPPSPGTPALPPAPAAPPTTTTSSSGGPPFPAPSKYPNGYPGKIYTVQAGDFGLKIAETITGNQSRWRELLVTNPSKADPQFGIKVFAGDQIVLPSSWQAAVVTPVGPVAPPAAPPGMPPPPQPGVPAVPVPQPGQVIASAQQLVLVQAMLVTFHGKHPEAGFLAPYGAARYGGQGDDLSGQWSQRGQVAMASFERWWNTKGKQPPVAQDGYPDEPAVAALQRQTSDDLALPIPPGPLPGSPPGPGMPAIPGNLPGGMNPPTLGQPEKTDSSSAGAAVAAGLLGLYALFG